MLKKIILTIIQVAILYAFSFIGGFIAKWLHLPISGSIIGLFIVLVLLHFNVLQLSKIELGASFLMTEMLLFFVPSVVAIIQYKDQFLQHGSQFLIVIVLGTITVMAATGLVAERIMNKKNTKQKKEGA